MSQKNFWQKSSAQWCQHQFCKMARTTQNFCRREQLRHNLKKSCFFNKKTCCKTWCRKFCNPYYDYLYNTEKCKHKYCGLTSTSTLIHPASMWTRCATLRRQDLLPGPPLFLLGCGLILYRVFQKNGHPILFLG